MKSKTTALADRSSGKKRVEIDLGHFPPYLLSRLHMHFQNLLLEILSPNGLLVADWRTLLCLSRRPTAYINDIVQFTQLPQATVSRSVKRLQEKGLLLKSDAEADRRASLVRISRSGNALLGDLVRQFDSTAQAELERLMGNDSKAFLELLRKGVKKSGLEVVHDL